MMLSKGDETVERTSAVNPFAKDWTAERILDFFFSFWGVVKTIELLFFLGVSRNKMARWALEPRPHMVVPMAQLF
jgi:hypothetical protein